MCDLCEGSIYAPVVFNVLVFEGVFWITASLPNRDEGRRSHSKGQHQPPLCVCLLLGAVADVLSSTWPGVWSEA